MKKTDGIPWYVDKTDTKLKNMWAKIIYAILVFIDKKFWNINILMIVCNINISLILDFFIISVVVEYMRIGLNQPILTSRSIKIKKKNRENKIWRNDEIMLQINADTV